MTTRKRATKQTRAAEVTVVDVPEVVVEEPVVPKLPQVYQATIFRKNGGPHEPMEVVGHVQYSETTGLVTTIPSPKYDSDLINFAATVLVVRGATDTIFSPGTIGWIKNLHKAELPRYWTIEEARSMNEV